MHAGMCRYGPHGRHPEKTCRFPTTPLVIVRKPLRRILNSEGDTRHSSRSLGTAANSGRFESYVTKLAPRNSEHYNSVLEKEAA